MGKHILRLRIPSMTDEGVFVIEDISTYDSVLPVSCETLQVTTPGAMSSTLVTVSRGFRSVLNACTVGILPGSSCGDSCPALPDGLYNVRYSVSPNDTVFVEYYHMRTTRAMNRYHNLLCHLDLQCCLPDQETQYQLQELDIIHNFILSAKVTAENCHHPQDAINQLRYANHLIDKLSTKRPFC